MRRHLSPKTRYIHGGAWRDPRIDHDTFRPTIEKVIDSFTSSKGPGIAAFASVDYRLSPHPEFPQDPAETPARKLRTARHPDHADDVQAALAYLQRRYGFGDRYVLVGHSAGACLAFQIVAGLTSAGSISGLVLPRAVIGFEGIYDFVGLNARMDGAYTPFFEGAFGGSRADWDAAAPVKFTGSFEERWGGKGAKVVAALGWSRDDSLVDELEVDNMTTRLNGDGVRTMVFKDLRGDHNEIWEDGTDVARMIAEVLDTIHDP